MSEITESACDDSAKKIFLRSHNSWKVGEKLPVSYVPTVEGMVVATRWIESVFMIVFLSPPFTKAEGTTAEAALMYKSAASLVKKPLAVYDYPFPTNPRILDEVVKANGNIDMLQELVKFMNKQSLSGNQIISKANGTNRPLWDADEIEETHADKTTSDRLSLHLLLSQQDEAEANPQIPEKLLDKLAQQVSMRLSVSPPIQQPSSLKQEKKPRRKKSKKASSSSSSSSDSDKSSSGDENVRCSDSEEAEGWFKCPFSLDEYRRTTDPRKKMKGKVEERRYIRKALHNIYNEFTTLKAFVDTIRTESVSSSSKPYNSDLIWLTFHANYLDILLLHAVEGPWHPWNELIVDWLGKSFLELTVRSSINRSYPDILDEKVRKWMKRKRIGLSAQFGAIPNYLIGAKITDLGIHPKGGWDSRANSESKITSSSTSNFKPKQQSRNINNDKKI